MATAYHLTINIDFNVIELSLVVFAVMEGLVVCLFDKITKKYDLLLIPNFYNKDRTP